MQMNHKHTTKNQIKLLESEESKIFDFNATANKRMLDVTVAQFTEYLIEAGILVLPDYLKEQENKVPVEPEFLTDKPARQYLGGISKVTFNKLRKEKKITSYHPSPGRTAYKVSELREYLNSQGKNQVLSPKKRNKPTI